MNRAGSMMIALCFTSLALAGDEGRGAKSLFIDSSTSTTILVTNPQKTTKQGKRTRTTSMPSPPRPASAEVSGLKFFVELIAANGESSQVTTDRAFRSGERILLHVTSSIDGDLVVYQRTPAGQLSPLFPDPRVRNGSAFIAKNVDTIIPSPTAWFRFDGQPGTEELLLQLTPRAAAVPAEPLQIARVAAPIRYEDLAYAAGSKGLVVETDNVGPEQAIYAVRQPEAGKPPEPIVVRVLLEHR